MSRPYESSAHAEKDNVAGQDEALLDIYRKLRPGEPPSREAAQTLLDNYYFNSKRYDLAKVGRYKINKKLGVEEEFNQQTLTSDDIVATIRYVVALHAGETRSTHRPCADRRGRRHRPIGNRRMRTVGELSRTTPHRPGRMERVVRERMTPDGEPSRRRRSSHPPGPRRSRSSSAHRN